MAGIANMDQFTILSLKVKKPVIARIAVAIVQWRKMSPICSFRETGS